MSSLNLLYNFKFYTFYQRIDQSIHSFRTRSTLPARLRSTPSVISVVEGRLQGGLVSRKRGWEKDSTKPITEPRMTYFVSAKRAEIVCCCF